MSKPVPTSPQSPGAALAALRALEIHRCPICDRDFAGIAIATYCSLRCRNWAKRERRRKRDGLPAPAG